MDELKKQQQELKELKRVLQAKINDADEQLLNIKFRMIQECGKTTGHEFITERELCIYGETFTWCKHCDYGN
jgi:hypothetical protein